MSPKRSKAAVVKPTRAAPAKATAPRAFVLPAWAVPLTYALITIILFRDFILGPGLLLGVDTQALSYFARNFYTEFVRQQHAFPLWDPLLFGGLPFIDGMHGDIFYPPSLALFFMNAEQMWGWKMALHIFLAGVFTHLWLRELGARREIALFGGLVYMMGADLVSLVLPGGDGKLFVSALAPLAFLLTERAATRRRVQDYGLLSLGVALMVYTSHMQLVYFAIWGISLYFIFRLIQSWRTDRRTGLAAAHLGAFALAGVVGVGAAAIQFFPPLGYLRSYSQRVEQTAQRESGYAFSTTYSLHAEEIASLVVPEFVGHHPAPVAGTYWGRNPFKINHEYAGFIPLLLLPLLFFRRRDARTWFFAGLGVLSLLYALGADTPMFRLFYLIPGVSLFRAPSLIIFLYALSIATLGAFGLDRALAWADGPAPEQKTARKYIWIAVGVMTLLALLAASGVLIGMWRALIFPDVEKVEQLNANLPRITMGFGITALLAVAVAAVWEGLARGLFGRGLAIALISVLVFLDLYRVDRPFIESTVLINNPGSPMFLGDDVTNFLQQRQQSGEVFRAHDLRDTSNLLAIHGIEQLAGHHGNEIGRYRALVGGDGAANLGANNLRLVDITNTKYLVLDREYLIPGFREVYRGSAIVYAKDDVQPRAYLAGRTQVVADSNAIQHLLGNGFDFRTTVALPEPLPAGIQVQPDPQGQVEWVERRNDAYRLRVTSDRPALLVVLDNFYPMWGAEVDGQSTPILRANYTFRAVPVPAGQHDVVFRYTASNLRAPAYLSGVLLLLLAVLGFGLPLAQRLRRRPATPA